MVTDKTGKLFEERRKTERRKLDKKVDEERRQEKRRKIDRVDKK